MSTKSAELLQLEHAQEDQAKQLTSLEKRLHREEEEYLRSSMTRGNDPGGAPQFGNLISGWEGILEGTRVDTNKGKEKIYSQSSVTWREYQDARAAERESRNQDAQAQAMRAAMKEAAEAGATGAEAEERGKAAAAAAAASFKVKTKVRKSSGGQASRHPRGEDE